LEKQINSVIFSLSLHSVHISVWRRGFAYEETINAYLPRHTQVFSALLLNRLYKLMRTVEKASGTRFVLQEGYPLNKEVDGMATVLPIAIPITIGNDLEKKQMADAISAARSYDLLVNAISLQIIEWSIHTVGIINEVGGAKTSG
jgi:hypothetical protein